jgi:hypothetical protein
MITQVTAPIKTSTNIALPNQKQTASPKARDHTGHDHKRFLDFYIERKSCYLAFIWHLFEIVTMRNGYTLVK